MIHPIALYFFSIIVISLWCAGFRKLIDYREIKGTAIQEEDGGPITYPILIKDEMLLWKLGRLIKSLGFWGKPLGSCIFCMPSFHGTILFWLVALFFAPIGLYLFVMWPIVCVSCVFTSGYIYNRLTF